MHTSRRQALNPMASAGGPAADSPYIDAGDVLMSAGNSSRATYAVLDVELTPGTTFEVA